MTIDFRAGSYAQTFVNLDVTRRELVELPLAFHRRSSDFDTAQGGRNLVFQWPGTLTWTLQPINLTTDFGETANHEYLKLRLSDWNLNTDYFTEIPAGQRKDQNGGKFYDYFISAAVQASNIPAGYPLFATTLPQTLVLGNLTYTGPLLQFASGNLQAAQSDTLVIIGTSKKIYPYNQGFMLRFRIEGQPADKRSGLIVFTFGEYAIRLNSNGVAELQQTVDGFNYTVVHTFQWTAADKVHSFDHNLIIYPHCRHEIEFLTQDQEAAISLTQTGVGRGPVHGSTYLQPGEIRYQPDGVTPWITSPAAVTLAVTREFRPYIQVSLIGFTNGTQPTGGGQAYLFDGAVDLHTFPTIVMTGNTDFDAYGCTVAAELLDPTTLNPWQPNTPTNNLAQFAVALQGLGDLNNGASSSRTPELFGYAFHKGPAFQTIARNTVQLPVTSVRIDRGDRAEAERLTVTIDNSLGQAATFAERGNIPLTVVDTVSGLTLFEGTGESVEVGEAVKPAPHITIEAVGMVDKLKRKHFGDRAPNFSYDPTDPQMRGYYWSQAVKWAFAFGGFDPDTQVVIEDGTHYDFRLWDDGSGGGTRGGVGSGSEGHVTASGGDGPRWKPKFDAVPDDYLQMLLCDWLGWHYAWNTLDHKWHIWKRPLPTNARDQANQIPVCSFWGQLSDAVKYDTTGLPVYLHSEARSHTTRPLYTTVIASAILPEAHVLTKAEYKAALLQQAGGNSTASDPLIVTTPRTVCCAYDNKFGYAGPANQPPNTAHPDYLGEPVLRWFTVAAPSRDALEWWTRMQGYDLTHGYVFKEFAADWGDAVTLGLRKWSQVYYNGRLAYIDTIEADWARDGNRRAHYRVSIARPDAPPPR